MRDFKNDGGGRSFLESFYELDCVIYPSTRFLLPKLYCDKVMLPGGFKVVRGFGCGLTGIDLSYSFDMSVFACSRLARLNMTLVS